MLSGSGAEFLMFLWMAVRSLEMEDGKIVR